VPVCCPVFFLQAAAKISYTENLMGRILLIDDDKAFSGFLASYIRDSFPLLQVEICNNPVTALQRIKAGGYDLMLIDLEMPSMDGMKLLSFATQAGMDKNRIVILSGRDANFLHELCPMGTCLAVLNKFEARQKAVLDMIFSSLQKKSGGT
jgi:CheY-like chemotaxis protein